MMGPRSLHLAAIALAFAVPAPSSAAFPSRSGETGFVEVPSAEVVGVPGAMLGAELRLDSISGSPTSFGAFPVYGVAGLSDRIEMGFSIRQWGEPGDELTHRTSLGAATKVQLLNGGSGPFPSLAVDAVFDGLNQHPLGAARLITSANIASVFRLGAFGGAELAIGRGADSGPVAGAALAAQLSNSSEAVAEGVWRPRGMNVGLALRWRYLPTMAIQLGVNYLPEDQGFRFSLGLAALRPTPRAVRPVETPKVEAAVTASAAPRLKEDRPHFRLKMGVGAPLGQPRHEQYGPFVASAAAVSATTAKPSAAVRGVAPSLEDLADAQLREQQALADARERRVTATADQLEARKKAALDEAKRLEDRERELTAREQQLDYREQRIAIRGAPTQQQRQLESLEAQLAAQERQLLAQERSLGPAIDAASGRARDAAGREEAERAEANRLTASASSATSRAAQVEYRKQALAARNRQLAALEARLVADGEHIDAFERQLRSRRERLDAWSRRLDTRSERLDLLEKRAAESRAPVAPKTPEPKTTAGGAPKDKAVFVMVVKSPTAIIKERAAAQTAPQAGAALHPGVAVEKAVAAATVVAFPTPTSHPSELDRETIDNIAKLAAKERCELLIWARAKDPSLMTEAQRRADEIKTRAISAGPLDPKQVVTRITTRPGAQGVDVVVSALRETAKPAAAAPAAPASSSPALLSGESGNRQIREAVQAAQSSIEACVGAHIEAKKLKRAEGTLKITISTNGTVTKLRTGGNDLAGSDLEDCLTRASGSWSFPHADAEYVVDVPITIIRGGAR